MKPILPNNCEVGCKHYTGGEMKHTTGCINYPDSLSRQFDENETRIQQLEAELLASRNFAIEIDKEHTKTIGRLKDEQKRLLGVIARHHSRENELAEVILQRVEEISSLKEELKKRDEDLGLQKIHSDYLQALLTSCESALQKRDEEIERIKQVAIKTFWEEPNSEGHNFDEWSKLNNL